MPTRRGFFASLAALCCAPLAKQLPKREPDGPFWKGRLLKIHDGALYASKVDDPSNWDLLPAILSDQQAWAIYGCGGPGSSTQVEAFEIIDDNCLGITATNGHSWLLYGDPAAGGFLTLASRLADTIPSSCSLTSTSRSPVTR